MSTHVTNKPPSTKVTLGANASLTVDTINVNKELPKELFNKFIPKRFEVAYTSINSQTYEYELVRLADREFSEHFSLYVDNVFIPKVSELNDSLSEYKVNLNFSKITLSANLYSELNESSNIVLIYTPI